MYIDTHTHVSKQFGIEPSQYIENALNNDVKYMIVSGCDKKSIPETLELIEKYECLYGAIGYHPEEVTKDYQIDLDILKENIMNNKIVAVGEIGLDYYWDKEHKEEQRKLFNEQLKIASEFNLPVVIHSRDSIQETYDILKQYNLKGVIHSFSGSLEMANNFIKLGFLLGINGVATFKNSKLYEVIEKIPVEKILLETDSPYLTPEPFRGKINESKNIPIIAQRIAEIKKMSVKEIEEITTNNAIALFDLHI